jgi:demethylmenaquinone methyltransferase/2-methoxy-6-polyprenyl-1,4-benzoquinol methylase
MAQTHFGFETVDEDIKASRVRGVFDSVATRYDLMNDVLSFGLHRAWKAYAVAVAAVQPGMKVLDIAGGTGDLAGAFAKRAGAQGCVVLSDINEAMLRVGRCWTRAWSCRRPPATPNNCHSPTPASTLSASPSACAT